MLAKTAQTITLEEMRESRETANVAFVKFTTQHQYFNSHIFCFYEGEDGKYYNQRIRNVLGENMLTFVAGNKKEVLKVWRRICNDDLYANATKLFFVDRDLDDPIDDINDYLYVTSHYSIENFYVNSQTFGKILNAEFGINDADDEYKKCIKDFKLRLNEFNNGMIEFNALVLLRKRKFNSNNVIRFSDYKTQKLFVSTIYGVSKSLKYDENIQEIKDKLSIAEEELQGAIREITEKGMFNQNFRGKNQLDFLVSILYNLKETNDKGGYFSEKLRCVYLTITKNRLSELSQYALTPDCLLNFLDKHKKGERI